jgi:hypothetical protein
MAATASPAPGGVRGSSASSPNGKMMVPGWTAGAVGPQAYGTGGYPFTTKRTGSWTNNGPIAGYDDPVTEYPWRAAGKLWMHFSNGWFVCTASLIKPSVLITAAHCVHNFGQQAAGYADTDYWYPAQYASTFPYGRYRGKWWYVPTPYWNGSDTCTTVGVVCNNDLAVVILYANNQGLATDNQAEAGSIVGWYSYGWNYSFVTSPYLGNRYAGEITQLGYPQAIDSGQRQIRTDSVAVYYSSGNLRNINWGSAQTGGSSGGPELVNFGTPPVHNSGSSAGTAPTQAVMGVTSWGYTNIDVKVQGASWFGQNIQFPAASYSGYGAGNIGYIVSVACHYFASACT